MEKLKKVYKILLADDNRFFCDALKSYLENNGFKVVAICNTIQKTISNANNLNFDVLILDLSFSGINAINYIKEIRPNTEKFKIICLSSFDNIILQQEVINHGVDYIVSKNNSIHNFSKTIINVLQNKTNWNTEVSKNIHLSNRQIEIIKACYEYSTEKEIANSLNISINTLKSHKQNIFTITNSKNNIELIKYAIKKGLLVI